MSRFYWKCPMCAMGIRKEAEVSELKNGTKVCGSCGNTEAKTAPRRREKL